MRGGKKLFSLGLEERDGLNRKLGGGLPQGSIVLIEGKYGAGKSVLCQRFAYGLCEMGNYVCYVTPELDLMSFLRQMKSLNYDMTDHILAHRFAFITFVPQPGGSYVEKLLNADRMWNGDVTIIDAFDQILRNDEKFETLFRQDKEEDISIQIVSFLRNLIRKEKTVVMTIDPTNLSEDALSPFRSVADVYLQLKMFDVGGEIRRMMEVRRFSGMGKQVGDSIGYSVRADVGIIIEARAVI